jgi:hypothetical protein
MEPDTSKFWINVWDTDGVLWPLNEDGEPKKIKKLGL